MEIPLEKKTKNSIVILCNTQPQNDFHSKLCGQPQVWCRGTCNMDFPRMPPMNGNEQFRRYRYISMAQKPLPRFNLAERQDKSQEINLRFWLNRGIDQGRLIIRTWPSRWTRSFWPTWDTSRRGVQVLILCFVGEFGKRGEWFPEWRKLWLI